MCFQLPSIPQFNIHMLVSLFLHWIIGINICSILGSMNIFPSHLFEHISGTASASFIYTTNHHNICIPLAATPFSSRSTIFRFHETYKRTHTIFFSYMPSQTYVKRKLTNYAKLFSVITTSFPHFLHGKLASKENMRTCMKE